MLLTKFTKIRHIRKVRVLQHFTMLPSPHRAILPRQLGVSVMQGLHAERQRVLPVATVNRSVCRHQTPVLLSTTASTTSTTTTTTATSTPPGELTGSRVLPPVNVSDAMSREQLRQHTERIYRFTVHKVAVHQGTVPVSNAGTATVLKDAPPTFVDTVSDTASTDDVTAGIIDSGCDPAGVHEMPRVSADVGNDVV